MSTENSKTILVRVPTDIVKEAQKLKREGNLSTIGNAIRYWIEQQKDEKLFTEIIELREKIDKVIKVIGKDQKYLVNYINKINPILRKTAEISCKLAGKQLGYDSKEACRMRELLDCPEQEKLIKEAWGEEKNELKKKGISYEQFASTYRKKITEAMVEKQTKTQSRELT